MGETFISPDAGRGSFHCPHCGLVTAQQPHTLFTESQVTGGNFSLGDDAMARQCQQCMGFSIWMDGRLIYPSVSPEPKPHDDMPADARKVYQEAREVAGTSPRSACALLRLALESLMPHLEAEGDTLHSQIGDLVEKGLDSGIQQALDSVRIVGNHAVHPGQISLADDADTASSLFEMINIVVEQMIARPKRLEEFYRDLPESKREGVEQRDSP